jgi:hypothetical protein
MLSLNQALGGEGKIKKNLFENKFASVKVFISSTINPVRTSSHLRADSTIP